MSQYLTAPTTRATPRSILLDAVVTATRSGAVEELLTERWAHASEVARLARDLAPIGGVEPLDASDAGLLHDVGELLLLCRDPLGYSRLLREAGSHAEQLRLEKSLYGVDHALLAAEHLLDLRVPHVVADAVADHHDPFRDSEPTTLVVAAADEMLSGDPARRHTLDMLGITPEAAALMVAAVRGPAARAS